MYVLCTLGFFSQLETTLSTPLSAISIYSKFLIRVHLCSYSGFKHILFILSYSGVTRVSKEGCFVWILGINPRMTFEVWLRMLVLNRIPLSYSDTKHCLLPLSYSGLSRVSTIKSPSYSGLTRVSRLSGQAR